MAGSRRITKRQKVLARHALGLPNSSSRSYRNRFLVAEGADGFKEWHGLAVDGYARRFPRHGGGLCDLFILTLAGARMVLKPGESLDPEDFPEG